MLTNLLVDLQRFERLFERKIIEVATAQDPAHDVLHFKRVVKWAKRLCQEEGASFEVVIPAAWLHDFVIIPKNDPRRSMASRLSADAAIKFLKEINYPSQFYDDIAHAIEAHSFSAGIPTRTLESKIVQDADRLDGLGAIGIARCFATAGMVKNMFYSEADPLCEERMPDDKIFALDHFYVKLLKLADSLQTVTGRIEGERRTRVLKQFLNDLRSEICRM